MVKFHAMCQGHFGKKMTAGHFELANQIMAFEIWTPAPILEHIFSQFLQGWILGIDLL